MHSTARVSSGMMVVNTDAAVMMPVKDFMSVTAGELFKQSVFTNIIFCLHNKSFMFSYEFYFTLWN